MVPTSGGLESESRLLTRAPRKGRKNCTVGASYGLAMFNEQSWMSILLACISLLGVITCPDSNGLGSSGALPWIRWRIQFIPKYSSKVV